MKANKRPFCKGLKHIWNSRNSIQVHVVRSVDRPLIDDQQLSKNTLNITWELDMRMLLKWENPRHAST